MILLIKKVSESDDSCFLGEDSSMKSMGLEIPIGAIYPWHGKIPKGWAKFKEVKPSTTGIKISRSKYKPSDL